METVKSKIEMLSVGETIRLRTNRLDLTGNRSFVDEHPLYYGAGNHVFTLKKTGDFVVSLMEWTGPKCSGKNTDCFCSCGIGCPIGITDFLNKWFEFLGRENINESIKDLTLL
jgi:hypothetical protein